MINNTLTPIDATQLEKFKDAARELECDEEEAAFEEKLKKIAKSEIKQDKSEPNA